MCSRATGVLLARACDFTMGTKLALLISSLVATGIFSGSVFGWTDLLILMKRSGVYAGATLGYSCVSTRTSLHARHPVALAAGAALTPGSPAADVIARLQTSTVLSKLSSST